VLKLCDVTNLDPDTATFYEVLFRRRITTKQRPCKIGTSLSVWGLQPNKKKKDVKNVILKDRDRHHKHGNKTLLNVNYKHVNGTTFGLYMENW